jgi:hypothetical protein
MVKRITFFLSNLLSVWVHPAKQVSSGRGKTLTLKNDCNVVEESVRFKTLVVLAEFTDDETTFHNTGTRNPH